MKQNLCFIDIETTGHLFGYHEIIEIAAILTTDNGEKVLDETCTKLKPIFPDRITPIAKGLNNFNQASWQNSPTSDANIWTSLKGFWENSIPVCHNPSFERAFITLEMMKYDIDDVGLGYHWIGTESLFWPWVDRKIVQKNSLSSILEYFKFPTEPIPHTAMNGANACRIAYIELMKNIITKI